MKTKLAEVVDPNIVSSKKPQEIFDGYAALRRDLVVAKKEGEKKNSSSPKP